MKNKFLKFLSLVLVLATVAVVFVSCSEEKFRIDTEVWELYSVQDREGKFTHGSSQLAEVADNIEIVDCKLTAKEGKLTLVDEKADKSYSGFYSDYDKTKGTLIYKIKLDEKKGNAVLSMTKLKDGSEFETLIIKVEGTTLTFHV